MGVNLRKVRQCFTVKRLSAVGFTHRMRAGGFSVNSTRQTHLAVSTHIFKCALRTLMLFMFHGKNPSNVFSKMPETYESKCP